MREWWRNAKAWVGTSAILCRRFGENRYLERWHHRQRAEPRLMHVWPPDYPYPSFPAWEVHNFLDPWPDLYTCYADRYFRLSLQRHDGLVQPYSVSLAEWKEEPNYRSAGVRTDPPSIYFQTINQQYSRDLNSAEETFRDWKANLDTLLMEDIL